MLASKAEEYIFAARSPFYIRGRTNTTLFSDSIVVSVKVNDNVNEMVSTLVINLADISMESKEKKIIIETKYYVDALTSRFGNDKFIPGNLYQLYCYLRNIEFKSRHSQNKKCEGILLNSI